MCCQELEEFKVVNRRRLYQDVVGQIQGFVRQGILKPGDRLPSEREMAERLKVSRSSIREAIRTMELQGLVESRPGAGTYIRAESLDALISIISSSVDRIKNSAKDIHEIRCLLEPEVAALAVERATEDDLKRIVEAIEDQERQIAGGHTGIEADTAFHFAVAQSTQNWGLLIIVSILEDALGDSRDRTFQEPARARGSLVSHREVLEAIRSGDAPAARSAMSRHLMEVEVPGISRAG